MIRVTNLFKQFNDQVVLDDMNFEIKEGQLVYILGESGSGKSVLLQHLIGLLKPDRGSIEIDKKAYTAFHDTVDNHLFTVVNI